MSMHTSAQVERYLAEVDSALVARGVTDRDEILAGLREHIGADGRDTAEVLRELGDPVMIAAAAADELGAAADGKRTGVRARGWFSILALGLTFVGAALAGLIAPLVLTLVGLVLMWLSQVWTVREKLWGTLLVPAPGLVLWIVLSYAGSVEECTTVVTGQDTQTVCTGGGGSVVGGVIATILMLVVGAAGIVMTVRLARRALAR